MASADIRELALVHRLAIWAAILGFIGAVTHILVFALAVPVQVFAAWRLGRAARYNTPLLVLAISLMFIPVVNILALVFMSHRAANMLKAQGVPVGPMGVMTKHIPGKKSAV